MQNNIIKKIKATLGICAVLAAMACIAGCSSSDAEQSKIRPNTPYVKAVRLDRATGVRSLELPGTAWAVRETNLSFRIGGPLVALNVDTGVYVEKGQVIARIDPRDFEIKVKTSQAQLSSAEAQLAEIKLQYARYSKLVATKAIARAEFDKIKAAYEVAQAQCQSAAKALEYAKNALADTVLKAPFSGSINQRFVDNHETISQGQPVASLVDLSAMEVKLALSEDLLPLVGNFSSFSCKFNALSGRSFKARLKDVAQKADSASRTYQVILSLDQEANQAVRPGMSAEVQVDVLHPGLERDYEVPLSALVNRGGQDAFVWVVQEPSQQLARLDVDIISLHDGMARISGRLNPGQWVVTAGVSRLHQGQTVRLVSEPSETNIGKEM